MRAKPLQLAQLERLVAWLDGQIAHATEVGDARTGTTHLRNKELVLLELGVTVGYESVCQSCDRFGTQFARRAKAARGKSCSTWHLDELFVKLRGGPYVWLYMSIVRFKSPRWMVVRKGKR